MDESRVVILDPEDKDKFTKHELIEFKKYWRPYRYWIRRLVPKKKHEGRLRGIAAGIGVGSMKGQLNVSKVEEWIKQARK